MSNCIEILNKCSGMDFPKNDSGYMVLTQCDFAQLPISEEKDYSWPFPRSAISFPNGQQLGKNLFSVEI